MAGRLRDKTAIITGAASGIGRESALLFASEGANVVVADMDEAAGAESVARIVESGGSAAFVRVDVSSAAEVESMIRFTEETFGGLEILFNNAGIFHPEDGSVVETTEEIWDRVISIDLKSVYLGCRYGIPALLRAGGGSIINTASFVALMGAAVPQIAYTAAKGGVLSMTREIAVEFARRNIRANALCPGPVETPLLAELLSDPERRNRRLVHIPQGRFARPEEMASAALFLASDESSYVNGATFVVDGGITAAYITPE
jgi:NAD(P)-dependent dehydrogenase (short-subunit alcohol dehydrogenase family)